MCSSLWGLRCLREASLEGTITRVEVAVAERTLLRIGAVSAMLGIITIFVANAFHGGNHPDDLEIVLPQYAVNANWEVVHIGQFLGYTLVFVALVALYRSIAEGRGAELARLGYVTAILATAIFAVNQAVDGVAVKYDVADEWVSASAAEKATALRVAEAVRHIEIGFSSFAELTLGAAHLLYGGDWVKRCLSQEVGMGGGGCRDRMDRVRDACGSQGLHSSDTGHGGKHAVGALGSGLRSLLVAQVCQDAESNRQGAQWKNQWRGLTCTLSLS